MLTVFASLQFAQAQDKDTTVTYMRDPEGRIREHNAHFEHMKLDVKFDAKKGMVFGDVTYRFKPIQYVMDTLFLDAPGIDIKTAELDGKPLPFTVDSAGVTFKFNTLMNWNKSYQLEIKYEATPRKGLYFIGWNVDAKNTDNDRYFTRKQIWTQGQGVDNRYWFPCYDDVDDKMLTETVITFDSAYTVVSNGELKSKKANADGTCTWHYAMVHPMQSYLVMIAIDKYKHKDYKSRNGITSRQYYYADRPETAAPTYEYSDSMMDFMVSQTGFPYPWTTYANIPVQDFMYGAMENTTATVYGDFLLNDNSMAFERPYVPTSAHELTHQWFGDCITEYSPSHHWLHESFATYFSKQFMHKINGEDAYQWAKRGEAQAAVSANKRDRYPIGHSKAGSNRVYPNGSFVLDMLRYVVGDSVFRRSITGYLQKHQYSNVTNRDFMMAFIENCGVNLDWFFDEWVFRAGVPDYYVTYEKQQDRLAFFVRQVQKTDELTGYFKMPVWFEVHFKDGTSVAKKQWLSHEYDTVYVTVLPGQDVDYTLFDPGSNILKTVSFKKSFEEFSAQALKAKNMIDRYDALVSLRDFDADKKRDVLVQVFNKGNFRAIQEEIIKQLAKDRNDATITLLKKALHDKDFMVRRAVVENLEDVPMSILPDFETALKDSSFFTIELALRKLCKLYPEKGEQYLAQVKGLRGINDNVYIAWLELKSHGAFADKADSSKYMNRLVEFTSNRYEFRTRVKAMDALEHTGYCDASLLGNLYNASLYTNSRLSNPAKKLFAALVKNPANLQLAKDIYAKGQWQDWERKIIDAMLK